MAQPTTPDNRPDREGAPVTPAAGRVPAGAGDVRGQAGHRGPGPDGRADVRGAAGARPLPARGCARGGQDARRGDAGQGRRRDVLPGPVHARPGAGRHRRHPDLPAVEREVRRRAGPRLRQLPARRRDQPGAGEGAVGAARGDGRAPGVDRRPDARGARPVPGDGHAEPDRAGGRVPAARGAARPVPDEDPGGLPDRRRGAGDRLPDGCQPAGADAGLHPGRPARHCSAGRTRCSCTTRWSTTRSGWCWPPARRPSTACPTSPS